MLFSPNPPLDQVAHLRLILATCLVPFTVSSLIGFREGKRALLIAYIILFTHLSLVFALSFSAQQIKRTIWLNFFLDESDLTQCILAVSLPYLFSLPAKTRMLLTITFAFIANVAINSRHLYTSTDLEISNLRTLMLLEADLINLACLFGIVAFWVRPQLVDATWFVTVGMLVSANLAKICLIDRYSISVIASCCILPIAYCYFVFTHKAAAPATSVVAPVAATEQDQAESEPIMTTATEEEDGTESASA